MMNDINSLSSVNYVYFIQILDGVILNSVERYLLVKSRLVPIHLSKVNDAENILFGFRNEYICLPGTMRS